jgi:hypothetical protein
MHHHHNLLKRQIRRFFGSQELIPSEIIGFVEAVNEAYRQHDMDREMLERSLELSSQELLQANSQMRSIFQAIPDLFLLVDHKGDVLDFKTSNNSDVVFNHIRIGKNIGHWFPEEVSTFLLAAMRKQPINSKIVNIEYSETYDIKKYYYETRLAQLLENQSIIIIRNITDRKRIEEALQ